MANPQAVIADAFGKLTTSISVEDAHNFASTELKDVWLAARMIEGQQRKRSEAQNLRRIEPFLKGLERYTKVIEVLCNGTPYMPYVWAPIKLMLEISSHYRDVFEALLSAYADIGAAMPRLDRYKETFDENPEFQYALANIYAGILDFHQRAYKFFRRRAWHIMFLSLWKDFGGRFESILASLKKQRDFIDVEAISFDIMEARESRSRMQDDIRRRQKRELELLEESERTRKISQLQHSIAWLSDLVDDKTQEMEHERISNRRHDGTCEWIVNESHLKTWMKDDTRRPCLWLDGKPGSGKSVMCSCMVHTLTNIPNLTTCYYFCHSQDSGNVCCQILTIIVLQILRQHPEVSTLIANEFVYCAVSCGMNQLKILVPKLLDIVGYARIVVDGVDECSRENQKAILKELQAICTGSALHCKILFSSRREPFILEKLSNKPQLLLDGRQEVNSDIRSFVKYKMEKLSTENQQLLDEIETILVEKANGMFLWVRLVAHELKYCYSDAALKATVTSLPKGLKAAYGRIIDRIMSSENATTAKIMSIRILGWMACSYRILKTYELLDGIAFDASMTTLSPESKIRKQILNLCRPLIEEGPANTVDFVHFSAKEYLLEEEYLLNRPFIWRENAHLDVSFSCITFLNSCLCLLPENSTNGQRAAIIVRGFHGLQLYADKFWYKHLLEYCCLLGQHQRQFSTELLTQLQLLLRFRKDNFQVSSTPIKVVTEKSPHDLSLEALNHLPDVKRLVSDVLAFRAKIAREDASDRNLEEISLGSCDIDPTHFGAIRHYYRQTAESLLEPQAGVAFPSITQHDLQTFRGTYGVSGFVCRYLHCSFSTDGFDSAAQRAKHESQHQRRYRCAYSSCVYFTPGFTSRNLLKKHIEKWHPVIAKGPTLAESIAAPLSAITSVTASQNSASLSSSTESSKSPTSPGLPKLATDRDNGEDSVFDVISRKDEAAQAQERQKVLDVKQEDREMPPKHRQALKLEQQRMLPGLGVQRAKMEEQKNTFFNNPNRAFLEQQRRLGVQRAKKMEEQKNTFPTISDHSTDVTNSNVTDASNSSHLSTHAHSPTPTPAGWSAQMDGTSGRVFYIQHSTGASQWEHPAEAAQLSPTPQATPQRDLRHPHEIYNDKRTPLQQQPASGAINGPGQIQNHIFQTLNTQTGPLTGWQARMILQERINLIMKIIACACSPKDNPPALTTAIEHALKVEKGFFERSSTEEYYNWEIKREIQRKSHRQMGNNVDTVNQKTAEAQLKEILADELYNPSFHVTSASESPTPALSSTLSPQKDVFSQRLQAANNQYLIASSSQVPVNVLSKERSEILQSSSDYWAEQG